MTYHLRLILSLSAALVCITSCTHKSQVAVIPVTDTSGYPDSVSKIIVSNCAISGCHNQASYQNAAVLLLTTWANMFNGGVYGAEVVAYSPKYSPLLYYCNAYDSTDPIANDPGHLPKPITLQQYQTLKNWIAKGAPDKNGNIAFSSNPATRQKIYLCMSSGCNQVAVIDAKSKLVMRYIPVGDGLDYAGHDIQVSADGMNAYLSLYSGSYVQKISTLTDTVVATANVGSVASGGTGGNWSVINLSPDASELMVSGWTTPGYIVSLNTATMQIIANKSVDVFTGGTASFQYPHGLGGNATWDTFFAALQYGNVINKFSFTPTYHLKQIPIKGNQAVLSTTSTSPDPHQIEMSPDYSKYFVTCQNSNEVRVMDTHTDALLDSIPVGKYPQEMAISRSKGYLFVACMRDDQNLTAGAIGSVYVIDINTLQVVKKLYGFFNQPHDVCVDEQDGLIFICSTNQGGVAHHISTCGGANGWYSVYDLNTLLPADNKVYEVLSFPYALANRF